MERKKLICKCGGKEFYAEGSIAGGAFVGPAMLFNGKPRFLPERISGWKYAEFKRLKCCECGKEVEQ